MPVRIRRPHQRTCERCGREERFDDEVESWVVADADAVGGVYCIHEWDINGSFVPFEDVDDRATEA
ncbi:HEWD family protein [Halobaculum limi]|uniref:HEWD family protein n=1 Tax=Halobaculum limi TaxID=3031916 RepID=UPI00240706B6|nr:HEWD family protein [Halobaculum sp. YSMS11]